MNGILYYITLVVGLFMPIIAQTQTELSAEYAYLWTGREVYISGEGIKFTGKIEGENLLSKVAYIELITPTGDKVNQSKLELIDGVFSGEILIPSDILSGYYFLRSYTKWMRNGSPLEYAYVLIKIINPHTHEVLAISDSLIDRHYKTEGIEHNVFIDSIVSIDHYMPKEMISFSLNEQNRRTHISVIPKIATPTRFQSHIRKETHYSQILFYPETRGITLSGILKSKKTGEVLTFHKVSVHILGEKDLMSVLSDEKGRFHFALPKRTGLKELFIIAASLDNDNVKIEIDQDFCFQTIALKVPEFTIKESEKESILKMVQNHQVFEVFHEVDTIKPPKTNYNAFYGEAFKTIEISYYVPLDSLEQYFTDIPSWVEVKKSKKKRYFQIVGEQGELKLFEPLVLIDWVPVDDADRILAIRPAAVDRIDIITQSYIHGDILYGGIINVLTKDNDFGGIKFPESGMYLNFNFYSKTISTEQNSSKFKNTYYWMPNIRRDSLNNGASFIAPQLQGEYLILFQGIDKNGKAFNNQKRFNINSSNN